MSMPIPSESDSQVEVLERLRVVGQPGLAWALERIANGEASIRLMCDGVPLVDDPALEGSVLEFLRDHGAELVRAPRND